MLFADQIIENYDLILIVLTGVYVASTLLLLLISMRSNKLSQKAVEEMRKQQAMDKRPYVSFDAYVDRGFSCSFKLENYGKTPAFDVQLSFDEPLKVATHGEEKEKVLKLAILKHIPVLTPNDPFIEYVAFFNTFANAMGFDKNIKGMLKYRGADDVQYKQEAEIDMDLISRTIIDDPRLTPDNAERLGHVLVEHLNKITPIIKKLK
ncbi:MAG: hypothetical protein K8S87_05730 [Planctomycetes bacterium]|nr:hypothetical protein [Planctomycetota bacterium]